VERVSRSARGLQGCLRDAFAEEFMAVSSKQLVSFFTFLGALTGASAGAHAQDAGFGISEVGAFGSGCPEGTWQSEISDDGLEATWTFDQYFAVVGGEQTFQTSNCSLRLGFSSTYEYAYAIDNIVIQADAQVAPDVSAQIAANASFQGGALPPSSADTTIDAPFSGTYFAHIPYEQYVWSPCGAERELNVATRIVLRNSEDTTQTSFVDLSSYGAGSGSRISVRLAARECSN
jgi:hypothetical protein